MKIAILGYSGSGKSTLAKYISDLYDIPVLYLDTVQFEPNWVERDRDEAVSMVAQFMENSSWVIDGNYTSFLQDIRLEQADKIIYFAFSRWNCLYRALRRYFQNKNKTRQSMATGCIEKMDVQFIWWILYEGRTRKRRQYYENILNKYSTKSVVLKNQKQLNSYMQNLFDTSSDINKIV